MGLQIVLYCLSLRRDWAAIFESVDRGLVSRQLSESVIGRSNILIPRLGWLVEAGGQFGLKESLILALVWSVLLAGGCFLLLGVAPRAAAILSWFLHLCAVKSGSLLSYGMDDCVTIGLFYLMIAPLPDGWALQRLLFGKRLGNRESSGFVRRILQGHLCIIYLSGGVAKAIGPDWWNGESLWRALTTPPFDLIPAHLLAPFRPFFPACGMAVVLLELGYAVFIWLRQTRVYWLMAMVMMHLLIGLTMGMHLFALVLIVLNLAAFGPTARLNRRASLIRRNPAVIGIDSAANN